MRSVSSLSLILMMGFAHAAEPVKSGPQPGEKIPGVCRLLNVTGPDAGQEVCLYCKNGANPVAMIFARSTGPAVLDLVKKIDAATAAHKDAGMGSFVVFLSDSPGLGKGLKAWADKQNVHTTILATHLPAGPAKYGISPDADVTVVLYTHRTVKVNHSFRAGELRETATAAILADLAKILPHE